MDEQDSSTRIWHLALAISRGLVTLKRIYWHKKVDTKGNPRMAVVK